ncbi:MAG: acetate/propionate family kinase [Methylomarinum sp.]|nr:acetate/propionate family kinase [Methylomarinum sp.]
MKILVLNSGSSSIKYSLFEMDDLLVLASGIIEQIGESQSIHKYHLPDENGEMQESINTQITPDHQQGLTNIIHLMQKSGVIQHASDLSAIGHRVVHGGELFHQPTLIDEAVLTGIRNMIPLAPLHNPANLMGIQVTMQFAEDIPQVAVFDTAFHQSLPAHAFLYAIPKELYQQERIRRYGFHGTSHCYVAKQAANFLSKPLHDLNLITLHLGNGGSVTAIKQGKSIDTSMGMTPLEGLMMGTRSGDIDPAIPFYLNQNSNMSSEEINTMLNKESGLKGICGENDMRAIHKMADAGDKNAQLALDMYCYRIKKYIGAYCAVLGQVDALVFTVGIGENDAKIRAQICEGLSLLGLSIDPNKNMQRDTNTIDINDNKSVVSILVIATNEELEIAMQSMKCIAC